MSVVLFFLIIHPSGRKKNLEKLFQLPKYGFLYKTNIIHEHTTHNFLKENRKQAKILVMQYALDNSRFTNNS